MLQGTEKNKMLKLNKNDVPTIYNWRNKNMKKCERCGWDFQDNVQICPNCDVPIVKIEGTCVNDGKVEVIECHPMKWMMSSNGTMLKCGNCGGTEFKNLSVSLRKEVKQ